MNVLRPFRFGVVAERVGDRDGWFDVVRRTETAGYDTLLIRDHIAPDFFGVQLGPIAALATAAAVTDRLRVGTVVIANDYRHPAILAKEIATLDVLSGGRVELGIGAGWLAEEYRQVGWPFDPNGVRVDRLEESVGVLKGLFADGPFTHDGTHYAIDGLDSFPKPVQRPHPPILIGAGHKRMLRLAGREADIVGLLNSSVASGTVVDDPAGQRSAAVAERIGWVAEGAGPRFPGIELSVIATVVVTTDRRAATESHIERRGWSGVTPEEVWDMPGILIGTPDEIAGQIRARRASLGLSYYVVSSDALDAFAPVVATLSASRTRDELVTPR